MRTIKVDPNILSVSGFSSPAEAIAAEERTDRAKQAAIDSNLVADALVDEFNVADQEVQLRLSNGRVLRFSCVASHVAWSIDSANDVKWSARDSETTQLLWPNGHVSVFDPRLLLQSRKEL